MAAELVRHVKKSLRRGETEHTTKESQRPYILALGASIQPSNVSLSGKHTRVEHCAGTNWRVGAPYDEQELATEASWQPYPNPSPRATFCPDAVDNERFRLYTVAADMFAFGIDGESTRTVPCPATPPSTLRRDWSGWLTLSYGFWTRISLCAPGRGGSPDHLPVSSWSLGRSVVSSCLLRNHVGS
ncbi:uncharacterized protein A1O5_12170 [Cladophialophora psammophila CBS 110553]|uniref:Uncharacterized protein n=1 Tax=Cladophialophora psammophila CBS 110553 TaxID=1182543 RepID=W9W3G8_9EURO|nr:uncharacterized protein A1O5_12170 [Cladophialophora psammophila CBS 110553]EXJ59545.1 hypothetical protein A1O5_12170 [Cladophialophora psammophila CBS 110553]